MKLTPIRLAISAIVATACIADAGEIVAPNVVAQFSRLAHHPDPMAINIGVGGDASLCMHYQGILRYDAPDGTPYMFLSRSGNNTDSCALDNNTPGELAVARLGSRPRHGERLRSNLLGFNQSQGSTPPPAADRIVKSIRTDGLLGRPAWMHLGGMQIIDDVLVIPAEEAWPDSTSTGALLFYDISDPENPLLLHEIPFGFKIGIVAVTQNTVTGQYVLAVSGGDARTVYFYETATADITQPPGFLWDLPIDVWDADQGGVDQEVRDEWEEWQNINFVRQDDGQLFLIAQDNTSFTNLDDDGVTKLFSVTRNGNAFDFGYENARKHKFTDPTTGNGAGGSGVYISPIGEIIVYSTELDNDGPNNSIRLGEIRSFDGSYITGGLDMESDFWLELYWDSNGWNDGSPDRSLMLDEADFTKENWEDLDKESDWGDEADSLRFFAPPGRDIILFKGRNFSESGYRLTGNGQVQSISNLDDISFGDSIHSVFIGRYRVPSGAEAWGQFTALKSFANSIAYSGSLELAFTGGTSPVILPFTASAGETILLTTNGTSTLLVAP